MGNERPLHYSPRPLTVSFLSAAGTAPAHSSYVRAPPLAAVQSEPAHQVWTGVSSPRPGGGYAQPPPQQQQQQQQGQLRQDAGRSPVDSLSSCGSSYEGSDPRLPLAHGTAETLSGRAAEPVCQAHASVRGLGLVIADAFLCKDFTLVIIIFVSAECECYIKYYNLYI